VSPTDPSRRRSRPGPQSLLVVEVLQDDGRALRFVEDQLEFLDRHPGRRASLVDPGDKRLHLLRRHIGEPHHADEHDRLLSSIDRKIQRPQGWHCKRMIQRVADGSTPVSTGGSRHRLRSHRCIPRYPRHGIAVRADRARAVCVDAAAECRWSRKVFMT
jgi:hypothetical protein